MAAYFVFIVKEKFIQYYYCDYISILGYCLCIYFYTLKLRSQLDIQPGSKSVNEGTKETKTKRGWRRSGRLLREQSRAAQKK